MIKLLFTLALIAIDVWIYHNLYTVFFTSQLQPKLEIPQVTISAEPSKTPGNLDEIPNVTGQGPLKEVVAKALEGTKGKYAIYIKNLKTEEEYKLNESEIFEPGSLYKLWVMGEAFQQIKDGTITKDTQMSQSITELNRKFGIDPENAELKDGGISQTVSLALNQMITISHNYSALLLAEKLKNSNIANFIVSQNLKSSRLSEGNSPPQTNAYDVAYLLEKMYKGEVVDETSSKEMLEIMKNQKLNDGLPKNLPEGVAVAHKTGDLGWFKHDAGIVYTDKGDYIIVVLSETNAPVAAQGRIADISKGVYDYFQNAN